MESCSDEIDLDSSLELLYETSTIVNTMGYETLGQTVDTMFVPRNILKNQEQMKSELLELTSKTKTQLTEAVRYVDLIENYIQARSGETANQLKFLFDRGKSANCIVLTRNMLLGRLRPFLMASCQNAELEIEGAGSAQAIAESEKIKELRDKVISLEIEKREILEWVGEKEFNKTVKINKEKKTETFREIFRSTDTSINNRINSTRGENQGAANTPATPPPGQQPAQEAEAVIQDAIAQNLPFPVEENGTDETENGSLQNIPVNTSYSNTLTSMTGVVHSPITDSRRAMATNNPIFPSVVLDLNQSQEDANNLCSHYERKCYVKFECCANYWPCHRCHNAQSTCSQRARKARDTKMVKCSYCHKEQQFRQFCCDCGAKFADYVCCLCKHLTGTNNYPYHCEECGICRPHGNRSFHCDTCGVCLNVQLRGNHICRAHNECCICLKDALTGCQVLSCSHKVHKKCASRMILSTGSLRCRICSESVAYKNA